MDTLGQAVYDIDMLFNLTSVVHWQVATAANQCQVDIDNVQENARRVTHDYAIGNQFYVKMTDIYRRVNYNIQGPYRITEVFKSSTF